MGTWRGPADRWPEHSKQWFQDALAEARSAGWHFLDFSSHSFGLVACRVDLEDRCEFPIFSTGRAGEDAAQTLQKMVRRCPHRAPEAKPFGAAAHLGRAEDSLKKGQRLASAAEVCLAAQDASNHAQELLEQAMEVVEHAQRNFDEALEEERAASELLKTVDPDLAAMPTVAVVEGAAEHHRDATRSLRRVTKESPRKRAVGKALGELRAQIEALQRADL
ncbi:hypothetical protein [Cellulosimicrobium sp. Marseille-Q4280]|uniref:hypothetical protein n=1 Tax=Cellulosimicrobium sp. Marseille-Q4280 TaxID=2937992 RepID=UPI00203F2C72|nr:hypothetical protein [Cellulosimicrobium sp. Marseille-Q4280]